MANLTRFDPFKEMTRWEPFSAMEHLYDRMRRRSRDLDVAPDIALDVSQDEKTYTVKAEIPGVRKEDIQVSLDGKRVTISAEVKREKEEKEKDMICQERYYGRQERSFLLDQEVDESKCEATYKDGVLQLALAKKPGGTTKKLAVK